MENIELRFNTSEKDVRKTYLECFINLNNELTIRITKANSNVYSERISLNKTTAIRLVKELKKQINFME